MPTVTGLREVPRNRVAVELDGTPWRVLPVEVVVRTGLLEGASLDRPALRLLRRELRRAEALQVAGRALRSRDLSRRSLAQRLERAGTVAPAAAEESLAALVRAGLLDDARLARSRARALAERGFGDRGIQHRLAQEGLGEHAAEAVAELVPETGRAASIVSRRGKGPRTARYLVSRGFGEEAVEAALGAVFGQEA